MYPLAFYPHRQLQEVARHSTKYLRGIVSQRSAPRLKPRVIGLPRQTESKDQCSRVIMLYDSVSEVVRPRKSGVSSKQANFTVDFPHGPRGNKYTCLRVWTKNMAKNLKG